MQDDNVVDLKSFIIQQHKKKQEHVCEDVEEKSSEHDNLSHEEALNCVSQKKEPQNVKKA